MELDIIMQFIRPETMIVIVACYAFGLFIKSSTIGDWMIPFILLAFAIIFTTLYIAIVLGEGFTPTTIITGFIQGLLGAALAVYGNQLIKQIVEKR